LDSLPKIAEQMPPVGDLNGVRSALADPVGIGAGTIAGDNLNAGMILQPGRDRCGLAIGQKIDHCVGLEVDDDGAVSATSLPRPVVDAENSRCGCRRRARPRRCQAQQRVGACGHRDPCGQARSGFAAECKAKMMVQFSQPSGPTAGTTRDLGQALRECPTAAVATETMKAARRDGDRDGPALPGEIAQ
jgi:hypothetical protein